MLRKKTSAIKYNKNYNPKIELMGWGGGVVGSEGGVIYVEKTIKSNLKSLY